MINKHQFGSRLQSLPTQSSSRSLSKTGSHHKLNAGFDEFGGFAGVGGEDSSVNDLTRRRGGRLLFQSMWIGAFPWQLSNQAAHANDSLSIAKGTVFVSGKVNLPPGTTAQVTESNNNYEENKPPTNPALYVTVRPNRPDNVPKAILDGSRGKSPPILAARFESPVFPFDFKLGEKDLTPEGLGNSNGGGYWWSADDLIVSARWDNDGVAATRSPEDLVGRNLWKQGTTDGFVLDLQGRGSFGKFATKKN